MGLIAELRLIDPTLFARTFDVVPEARCKFEDFHYVQDADGSVTYVFFWWVHECDPARFEQAIEADDTVGAFRHLTTIDERSLYRIETPAFPAGQTYLFPYFREHDILFLEGWQSSDGLDLTVRFPDRDALRSFRDSALTIADRVAVHRLFHETAGRPTAGLTEKQRDALSLALTRGYFDTPQKVSLSEIADEFGVAPQTLSRHIRLGVKYAVSEALDGRSGRSA